MYQNCTRSKNCPCHAHHMSNVTTWMKEFSPNNEGKSCYLHLVQDRHDGLILTEVRNVLVTTITKYWFSTKLFNGLSSHYTGQFLVIISFNWNIKTTVKCVPNILLKFKKGYVSLWTCSYILYYTCIYICSIL